MLLMTLANKQHDNMTSLTSYEDFQFETKRLDVIWLRVRFNFDQI